ncbi:MSO1 [Candida theae]|uniref:MSO1 n=1 Tax=Candida theae TaxID=1198502 RepID=A0AAD5FYL4_9ASCO|nr:MSO1 [Candida theae]KAI5957993.1 MSO1 [Candida theae]
MQHSNTGGGFFSKIKENYSSRFANLSLTSPTEKDGSTEDDTLIHRAFIKHYDTKGLPYPEWLGVKTFDQQHQHQQQQSTYGRSQSHSSGHAYRSHSSSSQFQPVRQDNLFNKSYAQRSYNQQRMQDENDAGHESTPPPFQRSSSRLQDMYNKSRQQSTPGSGYNVSRYSR